MNDVKTTEIPQEKFMLSASPEKAMQEMVNLVSSLLDVFSQENSALAKTSTREFLSVQEKKLEISRKYRDAVEQIIERKGEFKDVNPELKRKLAEMHETFCAISAENLNGINRLKKAVSRLGDRIMDAARTAARKESVNYSAKGNLKNNDRRLSVSINESA